MLVRVDAADLPERVHVVRRGFDAAFQRMCAASNVEDQEDELHIVLSQFYRLAEIVKKGMGPARFFEVLSSTAILRDASALLWVRTFDAHEAVVVAQMSGEPYSNFYTAMYGVLVWKPLVDLPEPVDRLGHGRHEHYQNLVGRPVLDSLRAAFDDVAALVDSYLWDIR